MVETTSPQGPSGAPSGSAIRSLAVVSGKGGTGKSVIIASLGYALAHCGFKTLILDMDLFTGGLTFYALAGTPRRPLTSLQDVFLKGEDLSSVAPVEIPSSFCKGNLFLLPAVSGRRQPRSELTILPQFKDVESFSRTVQDLVRTNLDAGKFDYLLMDTRGGTDLTSVATAIGASAFLIVTEADKTSWDVGAVLLDTLDEHVGSMGAPTRMGFVLNKNVLPAESIVAFLRKQWECPHLTTIPLDENAIRCYQEDHVPIDTDVGSPFSRALLPAIRKLFMNETWTEDQKQSLSKLEDAALKAANDRAMSSTSELGTQTQDSLLDRASVVIKLYGVLLATGILAYFIFTAMRGGYSLNTMFSVGACAILIYVMTASDPIVLRRFVDLFAIGRGGHEASSESRELKGDFSPSERRDPRKKTRKMQK